MKIPNIGQIQLNLLAAVYVNWVNEQPKFHEISYKVILSSHIQNSCNVTYRLTLLMRILTAHS
jgi:hypothetical protein